VVNKIKQKVYKDKTKQNESSEEDDDFGAIKPSYYKYLKELSKKMQIDIEEFKKVFQSNDCNVKDAFTMIDYGDRIRDINNN